ncbi:MAG: hypothetical protein KKD73_01780 [Proteobacteria bacterium]|nr:hypothetical protein [Pseudomonadota bacterium]MBU1640101.1 hypothetical protein [Pseudomonadota bacterium]
MSPKKSDIQNQFEQHDPLTKLRKFAEDQGWSIRLLAKFVAILVVDERHAELLSEIDHRH